MCAKQQYKKISKANVWCDYYLIVSSSSLIYWPMRPRSRLLVYYRLRWHCLVNSQVKNSPRQSQCKVKITTNEGNCSFFYQMACPFPFGEWAFQPQFYRYWDLCCQHTTWIPSTYVISRPFSFSYFHPGFLMLLLEICVMETTPHENIGTLTLGYVTKIRHSFLMTCSVASVTSLIWGALATLKAELYGGLGSQ